MKKRVNISVWFVCCALLFLASYQQAEKSLKIDKSSLKMSIDDGVSERVANEEFLIMRCDCSQEDYDNFMGNVQSNSAMAARFMWIPRILQKKLKQPVDSLPDLQTLHQRFQASIQGLPTTSNNYKMLVNWAGYGAIKVYFLRVGVLNNEQKQILGEYMQLLIANKNMNLPELADALEKLEGFWSSSQVHQAATTILTNEVAYNNPSTNINGLSALTNDEKNIVMRLHDIDVLAREKLQAIALRNQ